MNRRTLPARLPLIFLLLFCAQAAAGPSLVPETATNELPRAVGRLAIRAVQGTPGGPAIADIDAEIDLMHNGVVIASLRTRLDEQGMAVVDDAPIGAGVIPVVKIAYAGVTYLHRGEIMDASHPSQTIDVECFEVTEQEPSWVISMRHVMLVQDRSGLKVTEILQIENDADRTWIGSPVPLGKPRTTSIGLPIYAADVQLGNGFHGWCCTTMDSNRLFNHLPLMPGTTEMTLSYRIRTTEQETPLFFSAPAPTAEVSVIVPQELSTPGTENLEPGGTTRIADTDVRFYVGKDLPAESSFTITVAAPASYTMGATSSGDPGESPATPATSMARWIAAGGGAVILLGAGALLLFRRGTSPSP